MTNTGTESVPVTMPTGSPGPRDPGPRAGYRWMTWRCLAVGLVFLLFACTSNKQNLQKRGAVYRGIGEALLANGDYTAALREFLKAEKIYADDPILQNYMGLAYRAKKQMDRAVVHFKKALRLKADYASAMNNLGEAYLVMQDWDAAIAVFKQLEQNILYATPQFSYFNIAWAYFNKKDYITAETYYQRVVAHYESGFDQDLTYIKALRGLGRTRFKLGKPEAAAALEEALQLAPDFLPAYLDLAEVYASQEATPQALEKAIGLLQKVIEKAPKSPFAQEAALLLRKLKRGEQP